MVRFALSFSAVLAAASALPLSMRQVMMEASMAPVVIDMATPEPIPTAMPTMMPTPMAPTPMAPTPMAPTPMAPTPMAPTPMAPTPMAPTPMAPTPMAPTPMAPTPIAPTPMAPTPMAPTPMASPESVPATAPMVPTSATTEAPAGNAEAQRVADSVPPPPTAANATPLASTSTEESGFDISTPEESVVPEPTTEATTGSGFDTAPAGATPSPSPVCFPGSATVALADGSVKMMSELELGDRVSVGGGLFSEVFTFTHRIAAGEYDFVKMDVASGASLRLTAGHYLPINSRYIAAGDAKVGDSVELASGVSSVIQSIELVKDTGLYNPQTAHGDIVVNGVRASTYTTAVQPRMAHALLAPLRAACDAFGVRARFLEAGADRAARIVSALA